MQEQAPTTVNESGTASTSDPFLTQACSLEVPALEIPTARGLTILADSTDRDLIAPYSWYAVAVEGGRFYAQARVPKAGAGAPRISMHRLIMTPPDGMVVHHINNNGLDNRRQNLAAVTQAQNIAAHHNPRRSGVYMMEGRYRAALRINKRRVALGMYDDSEDAYAAVREARACLFAIPENEIPAAVARITYRARMGHLRGRNLSP